METYIIRADAASAESDGATTTAGGATLQIGGIAPNKHALLRFDLSTIPSAEIVMQSDLSIKTQALGAAPMDIGLWGADFGAAIANADWGVEDNNALADYRQQITNESNPLIDGATVVVATSYEQRVPSQFVKPGNDYADFVLKPFTATTLATQSVTIHGPGAASEADKPTLTVIALTAAELVSRNPFRYQATGAESFLAFGREGNEGVAVKACVILDADNVGLTAVPVRLTGNGNSSNRVKPRKSTVGEVVVGGQISFDLTPEKCTQLLTGILKLEATVDNGDGTYDHTFKVAESHELASFTMVTKKGPLRMVYPGCKINRLGFSLGLDQIIRISIDVMGLEEWVYDWTSAGLDNEFILDDNAAYDTVQNGLWSFIHSKASVGGNTGDCIQGFSLDFGNNLRPRRGLNGKRGPSSHTAGAFTVGANFNLYFENEHILKKILGTQSKGFPFKAGKRIEFDTIQILVGKPELDHRIQIDIPKAVYLTKSDTINGEDDIMIDVQTEANFDEMSGSNITMTLRTAEPASAFEPTSNLITVQPLEEDEELVAIA